MSNPTVIVITGPTATGKTELGVAMAATLGGEVVSADSMQIYKHMNIGTAKPTVEETRGVPHHMFDIIEPTTDYSVARYVKDAARCIDDIIARQKQPILVGGTGLYINSLLAGREFSKRGDKDVRKSLEVEYDTVGGEAMLERLREFDPESASKLYANDKKRIVRAIEVYITTGKTISQHDAESKQIPPRYDSVKLALTFTDRGRLYERIDRRVDNMIAAGLEEEVAGLLKMGVSPDSTAMQAIGYKEMVSALNGEIDMTDAIEIIKMESRRLAKRQLTWLRADRAINWIIRD